MSRCRCDHPGHPDWHNFDCPVDPPQLDPDEVREWLKDAAERRDLPSMPDDPERLSMDTYIALKSGRRHPNVESRGPLHQEGQPAQGPLVA